MNIKIVAIFAYGRRYFVPLMWDEDTEEGSVSMNGA
jgi:hypothetical protein